MQRGSTSVPTQPVLQSAHPKRSLQVSGQPNQKTKSGSLINPITGQSQPQLKEYEEMEIILKMSSNSNIPQPANQSGTDPSVEFDAVYLDNASTHTLYQASILPYINSDLSILTNSSQLLLGKQGQTSKQRAQSMNSPQTEKKENSSPKEGLLGVLISDLLSNDNINNLSIQALSLSSNGNLVDKLQRNDPSVYVLGEHILGARTYRIENREHLLKINGYLTELIKGGNCGNLVVRVVCEWKNGKKTCTKVVSSSNEEFRQLFEMSSEGSILREMLKPSMCGCSKLLFIASTDNADPQSTIDLCRHLSQHKAKQPQLAKDYNQVDLTPQLNQLPVHLREVHYIESLPKLVNVEVTNVQVVSKQRAKQQKLKEIVAAQSATMQSKQKQPQSLISSPQQNMSRKQFVSKEQVPVPNNRMTTINENTKDEFNSYDQKHVSKSSFLTSPSRSFVESKNEIETHLSRGLDFEAVRLTKEEVRLMGEMRGCDKQIKKVREEINQHNHKKRQQSKQQQHSNNKTTHIESLKKTLSELENKRQHLEQALTNINQEKKLVIAQINQLVIPKADGDKDQKLREMEEKIKEMARALEEKDKLIEETKMRQSQQTICLKELQETVKTLKQKPQGMKIDTTSSINIVPQKEVVSPRLPLKKAETHKPSANTNKYLRQKQHQSSVSSSSGMHSLSESSSQSLINMGSLIHDQSQTLTHHHSKLNLVPQRALELDHTKNHIKDSSKRKDLIQKNKSASNLFKKTKPTVVIKIGNEERGGNDSHNSSVQGPIVLQQTVSGRVGIRENKMSMVEKSGKASKDLVHWESIDLHKRGGKTMQSNCTKSHLQSKKHSQALDHSSKLEKEPTIHSRKLSGKENFISEDVDEGVQNFKKSVVPVRSITNLMGNGVTGNTSFDSNQKVMQSCDRSYFAWHSPTEVARKTLMQARNSATSEQKASFSKVEQHSQSSINLGVINSINNAMLRETSLKQFHLKSFQANLKKQNTGKLDRLTHNDEQPVVNGPTTINDESDESFVRQLNQEDNCDRSCNEGLQNTPPRIQQKISELASKNKFTTQATKPKVAISIQIQGSKIITKEPPNMDAKYKTQDINDSTLNTRAINRTSDLSIENVDKKKQEKLDNFLRRSYELMNTLRNSADQVVSLQPVNRQAARLRSLERSGFMSTKNVANTTMQPGFSQQVTATNKGLVYSKSPQQHNFVFGSQDTLLMEHSKTMDSRVNTSNHFTRAANLERKITDLKEARLRNRSSQSNQRHGFNTSNHEGANAITQVIDGLRNSNDYKIGVIDHHSSMVDLKRNRSGNILCPNLAEKFNELDSLFKTQSMSTLHLQDTKGVSSLKEQILAKCMKSSQSKANLTQYTQEQEKVNKQIQMAQSLMKCSSNDIIPLSVNSSYPKIIGRARSITIDKQDQAAQSITAPRLNCSLSIQSGNRLPKWGELAQIIKRNLSPTGQQASFLQSIEEKPDSNQLNSSKGYMVKYNKIDLSKTSPCNQSLQQFNSCKPPTNPQAVFKKRKNWEVENIIEESYAPQQQTFQQRGRSESQYLPTLSNNGMSIRTPRGHNPSQLGLQSPSTNMHAKQHQQMAQTSTVNNSYYNHLKSQYHSKQSDVSQSHQQFQAGALRACLLQGPPNQQVQQNQPQIGGLNLSLRVSNANMVSSSAEFTNGLFKGFATPQQLIDQPIGSKTKPEVTELIERQRSRINSQSRKGEGMYNSNSEGNFQIGPPLASLINKKQ